MQTHEIGFTEHGEIGHKVIGWRGYISSPCGLRLDIAYEFSDHDIAAPMRLCKRCFSTEETNDE